MLREEPYCWLCGKRGSAEDPLVADHVIPRSKGGTTTRSNLRAAHSSCNARRGDRGSTASGLTDPPSRFSRNTLT
jgi:5-methylcytosine-specific restriction endonuclease McrA